MSDRLLYALASRGSFKADDFYDILSRQWNEIDNPEGTIQTDKRLEYIRFFEALGFAEIDWVERKIFATPTTWIVLPKPGLPEAVLVGGRSPALLREIRKSIKSASAKLNFQNLPRHWMGLEFPNFISITGTSVELLMEHCGKVGDFELSESIVFKLVKTSSSLEQLKASMKFTIHGEPNWRRGVFDVEKMRFLINGKSSGESRFSAYTDPQTYKRIHVIWRNQDGSIVSRDWGRYYAFQEAGKQVLFYDESKQALAVPATAPLPTILLRAVAMCSAKLPFRVDVSIEARETHQQIPYNVFLFVPKVVANMVADKVGQQLVNRDVPEINRSDYVRF